MKAGRAVCAIVLLAFLAIGPTPAAEQVTGPRQEEVLYWDDGWGEYTYPPAVPDWPWTWLAVRFQAPGWARSVVGMKVYIMNDQVDHPDDPYLPTTQPIVFWVWGVGEDSCPGVQANDGYAPFSEMGEYQEDAWLEARFPNPIDITDPAHFPDGWFFVGIEWLHARNPLLGLDTSDPTYGHTVKPGVAGPEWLSSDALIRAVVSSEWSPIDASSWTYIKTLFQK
jgi:hypothetical protein